MAVFDYEKIAAAPLPPPLSTMLNLSRDTVALYGLIVIDYT